MTTQLTMLDTPPPLRFLILGGGAIVSECHLPALQVLGWSSHARVVDILDRNLEALRTLAPEAAIEKRDFREALREQGLADRFDAALVALPPSLHDEACALAIGAGLHVLCEKPLALDPDACRRLHDQAASAERVLCVAMVRRFVPSFRAMDAALCAGLVGEIREIDIEDGAPFRWNSDTETVFRLDQGGILAGMGVHFLDRLVAAFGPLTMVSYTDDSRGGPEANCEIRLTTERSIPIRLKLSWTHELRNTFEVRGDRGALAVGKNTFGHCIWRHAKGGCSGTLRAEMAFESGDWRPTFESCFVEQLHHFARAVNREEHNLPDAAEAAATMDIINWAYTRRTGARSRVVVSEPGLPHGRIVVTGGTGFVGTRLVERIDDLGHREIVVPVRSFRTAARVAACPVVLRRTDLTDPTDTRAMLEGARQVFHLAYGSNADRDADFTIASAVNVTRQAIAAGVETVVIFSTSTVLAGHKDGALVDETWPYKPAMGAYGRAKAEMERRVLELACGAASSRTRVILLEPGVVYGPWGRTYTELPARLAREGAFCWFDEGTGLANYVYVDNLIDAAFLAATCPRAHAKRFLITDGSCTWREFLGPILGSPAEAFPSFCASEFSALVRTAARTNWRDILSAAMQNPPLMAAISGHPILGNLKRAAARVPGLHRRATGIRPSEDRIRPSARQPLPLPPEWLLDLFGPSRVRFSPALAHEILRWAPRVGLAEGQAACRAWLAEVLPGTQTGSSL